jgi:hypothetical protein
MRVLMLPPAAGLQVSMRVLQYDAYWVCRISLIIATINPLCNTLKGWATTSRWLLQVRDHFLLQASAVFARGFFWVGGMPEYAALPTAHLLDGHRSLSVADIFQSFRQWCAVAVSIGTPEQVAGLLAALSKCSCGNGVPQCDAGE